MVRYCGDAMVVHPTTMGPWEKFWKCSARSIMAGAGRRAFHQRLWMRVVMQVCVCVPVLKVTGALQTLRMCDLCLWNLLWLRQCAQMQHSWRWRSKASLENSEQTLSSSCQGLRGQFSTCSGMSSWCQRYLCSRATMSHNLTFKPAAALGSHALSTAAFADASALASGNWNHNSWHSHAGFGFLISGHATSAPEFYYDVHVPCINVRMYV